MNTKPRDCVVEACPNLVPAASEFEKCAQCRANDRSWKRKRPKQWFDYRQKLTKWSARMDLRISETNVTVMRKESMSTKKALPGTPEYKWTDAQRAKFRATMKAKKAQGWKHVQPKKAKQMPRVWSEKAKSNGHAVQDAIGWLRYGEESATRRLREGKLKQYDEAHIYLMLARRALEGGGR